VSSVVRLPDLLADQLAVEAVRRGVSVDELSAEILRAGLSAAGRHRPVAGNR